VLDEETNRTFGKLLVVPKRIQRIVKIGSGEVMATSGLPTMHSDLSGHRLQTLAQAVHHGHLLDRKRHPFATLV
jgi:hypothetical protein